MDSASKDTDEQGEVTKISEKTHIRVRMAPTRGLEEVLFLFLYSEDILEFERHYMEYVCANYQPIGSGSFKKNADGSTAGSYVMFRRAQKVSGEG